MPVSRWPRSGRDGTPQGRGTPPRTKETKPWRIRKGDREGRPYAGLVAGLFWCKGDPCGRPCRFPDGLVRAGTGRRKGVARHLVRRKRSRGGFGRATARVAPTRASSPGCSGVGATLVVAHAGFPDGLVRVGTGRRKGVARHLVRRKRSLGGFGRATARVAPTRASSPGCSGVGATLSRPQGAPSPMPVSRWPRSGRDGTPQGRGTPPRTKETKPWRIREGRRRALRAR